MTGGFTLLELLVVLMIVALSLSLTLPALSNIRRPSEREKSLAALRDARTDAVRRGRSTRVQVWIGQERLPAWILFQPDGRALGPCVNPLAGDVICDGDSLLVGEVLDPVLPSSRRSWR